MWEKPRRNHFWGRPTYTSADLYFTGIILFSFLFISYPQSSLNGTEPYPATRSEVSVIRKCMSEIWGSPSPYKSGAQNRVFWRPRKLRATLTAYIFRMKHDMHNRLSALTATRGLLHRVKISWIYSRLAGYARRAAQLCKKLHRTAKIFASWTKSELPNLFPVINLLLDVELTHLLRNAHAQILSCLKHTTLDRLWVRLNITFLVNIHQLYVHWRLQIGP